MIPFISLLWSGGVLCCADHDLDLYWWCIVVNTPCCYNHCGYVPPSLVWAGADRGNQVSGIDNKIFQNCDWVMSQSLNGFKCSGKENRHSLIDQPPHSVFPVLSMWTSISRYKLVSSSAEVHCIYTAFTFSRRFFSSQCCLLWHRKNRFSYEDMKKLKIMMILCLLLMVDVTVRMCSSGLYLLSARRQAPEAEPWPLCEHNDRQHSQRTGAPRHQVIYQHSAFTQLIEIQIHLGNKTVSMHA